MIKVFSGNWRGPGKRERALGLIVSFEFRYYLKLFKGARLHVFMAIVLHSDDEGHSYPSYTLLERETGYNRHAIGEALNDLCRIEVEGHPVLIRWRERDEKGKLTGSNHYLIFPTDEEVISQITGAPLPSVKITPPSVETTLPEDQNTLKKAHSVETTLVWKPALKVKPLKIQEEEKEWIQILHQLNNTMRKTLYDFYIEPLVPIGIQDGEYLLAAPNEEIRLWNADRMSSTVNRYLVSMYNQPDLRVKYVLQDT